MLNEVKRLFFIFIIFSFLYAQENIQGKKFCLDKNQVIKELDWITTSAVPRFDTLKKYYTVQKFKIGGVYDLSNEKHYEYGGRGGVTLESLGLDSVQIGYVTLGKARHNANGEIDNAILICPYYSGDSTNMLEFWSSMGKRTSFAGGIHIGPGKLIDTNRYYVILIDALGLWGASKPSSSHPGKKKSYALGLQFPQYRLEDCVQLMYRLLKDKLKVARLRLVTGVSMGGTLTYAWGVLHPHFVEAIMPIGGTPFQDSGIARWLFDLMTAAIESDPVYRETRGDYYKKSKLNHPILGNMFGWSILKHSAFIDEYRVKQGFEHCKKEIFDWKKSPEVVKTFGKKIGYGSSLFRIALIDANDLIYRNRAQTMFNVEPYLSKIQARTLIIHISTDQWLYLHLAKRAKEKIAGSKLLSFPDKMGHYAVFKALAVYKKEIRQFLNKK